MSYAKQYSYLGADPAPGDSAQVASLATQMTTAATSLANVLTVLEASAEGEWKGETAIAFRAMMRDDFTPKVQTAKTSFSGAGTALDSWATSLSGFRTRADELDTRLMNAQNTLETRQQRVSTLQNSSEPAEDHDTLLDTAEDRVTSAQAAVQSVWDDVAALVEDYRSAAEEVTSQLNTSSAYAPNEPGWFDSVIDGIKGMAEFVANTIKDAADWALEWAAEHAEFLKALGDVFSVLSAICGLLSFIPILAPFTGPLAVGLALAAAGTQYLAAAGKAGSWTEGFKNPDMWFSLAGAAMGAGAIFSTYRAATAAGTTARNMPGLFGLMRSSNVGYSMKGSEMAWRSADVLLDQTGTALSARTFAGDASSTPGAWQLVTGQVSIERNEGALIRTLHGK